jgi:hypothetical protein
MKTTIRKRMRSRRTSKRRIAVGRCSKLAVPPIAARRRIAVN